MKKSDQNNEATVLLVMSSPERRACLSSILKDIGARSVAVRRGREARNLLQSDLQVDAVVTDATLDDANWCDVLGAVVDHNAQASVVVVAPPSADEILWSEVLWRGVHDMLVEPFSQREARAVLEGALRAAHSDAGVAAA